VRKVMRVEVEQCVEDLPRVFANGTLVKGAVGGKGTQGGSDGGKRGRVT
jgi:hypothetical protein